MELFYTLLGFAMLYSWGHFFVVQHDTPYKKRSGYEKFLTWGTLASWVLIIVGLGA